MAGRGVHFALTEEQRLNLHSLVESGGDVVGYIAEDIEEAWDEPWLCQTDKAWDAIHRCLTDGTLSAGESTPLQWCVLNGAQLYVGDDYIISFVSAEQVPKVVQAIAHLEKAEFRARYAAIDSIDYGMPLSDEDFDYTWAYFEDLRNFYSKAGREGRSVVFTVDQ